MSFLSFHHELLRSLRILPEYLEKSGSTLSKSSDKTIENTHSKLDSYLRKRGYFRKNLEDENTGSKLLEGILGWNSYVLGDNKT